MTTYNYVGSRNKKEFKVTQFFAIFAVIALIFAYIPTSFVNADETKNFIGIGDIKAIYTGSNIELDEIIDFEVTPNTNGYFKMDTTNSGFDMIGGDKSISYTNGTSVKFQAKANGKNNELALLVSGSSPVKATYNVNLAVTGAGYKLESVKMNNGNGFSKGAKVTADITLKNLSTNALPRTLTLGSGAFKFVNGAEAKSVTIPDGQSKTFSYEVVYDGTSKNFNLTITSTSGSSSGSTPDTTNETAYISNATIDGGTVIPPKPDEVTDLKLQLSSDIPEILASGAYEDFKIKVKNNSKYSAFFPNIAVNAGSEGTEGMFRETNSSYLSGSMNTIAPGYSSDIALKIVVPTNVKSGYYTLKVVINTTDTNGKLHSFDLDQKIYVNNPDMEDTKDSSIRPTLRGIKISPLTPIAGQNFKLSLTIENKGTANAKNVEVLLSGLSATGVYATKGVAYKNISNINPNETTTVTFELKASPKADGVSPISAVIKYNDVVGASQTLTTEVSVPIKGIQSSFVEFSQIKTDKSLYNAGNTATATVIIKNVGTSSIKNAKLRVEGFSGITAVLQDGLKSNTALRSVGTLNPGQFKSYTYILDISSKVAVDVINLKTILSFTDAKGDAQNAESAIYLFTNPSKTGEGDKGNASTPRVIIEKYKIDTEAVTAGKEFKFEFTLKNTSKTKNVKNMKVTISSADGIFNAVEGSNTFFIENIKAQGTNKVSLPLVAKNDAETKSYPLGVGIEYEDDEGKPYTSTENINLRVLQPQILEITNTNIPTSGDTMSGLNISFTYINKGKTPLLNLNVKLDGDFNTDTKENFLGNIPAGNMANFEATIMPNMAGPLEGNIIITYEDAVGTVSTEEIPIKSDIMDFVSGGGGDIDIGIDKDPSIPEKKPLNLPIIIGGSVAGIVVLLAVLLLIKKRLRIKKEAIEDEED